MILFPDPALRVDAADWCKGDEHIGRVLTAACSPEQWCRACALPAGCNGRCVYGRRQEWLRGHIVCVATSSRTRIGRIRWQPHSIG